MSINVRRLLLTANYTPQNWAGNWTLTSKFDSFFITYLYSLRIESTQNSFNNSYLYINFSTYTEKIFCSFFFFWCIFRWLMCFPLYSCHLMFWSHQVTVGRPAFQWERTAFSLHLCLCALSASHTLCCTLPLDFPWMRKQTLVTCKEMAVCWG